jgi:hypothetical protein
VAELPLLHSNAILCNGRLIQSSTSPWGFEERKEFTLDFSRGNLDTFHRFEPDNTGQLIVPEKLCSLKDDPEANALFVGIGAGGDPYAYIIACTELLRFFYATSSVMIRSVLSDDFLDPNRNLWNVALSYILPDGKAFLQLRKRMFDADAPFMARFAFSPYAQMQAREIYLYAAGMRREDDTRTIRALPPFEGRTRLIVNAIPMDVAGSRRWLISRLISCDWRPPYTHLDYQRDNDGRRDDRNINDRTSSGWQKGDFNRSAQSPGDPPDVLTLLSKPASTELTPWGLKNSEINERFPEL